MTSLVAYSIFSDFYFYCCFFSNSLGTSLGILLHLQFVSCLSLSFCPHHLYSYGTSHIVFHVHILSVNCVDFALLWHRCRLCCHVLWNCPFCLPSTFPISFCYLFPYPWMEGNVSRTDDCQQMGYLIPTCRNTLLALAANLFTVHIPTLFHGSLLPCPSGQVDCNI